VLHSPAAAEEAEVDGVGQQAVAVVPLFDRITVGLAEVDSEGILRRLNPCLLRLFGYDDATELIGHHVFRLIPAHEQDRTADDMRALWSGRSERYQRDRALRRRDGSSLTVQVTVELATMDTGEVRLVATVVDASARIAALAAAEQAQTEAEERRAFATTLLETIDVGVTACDASGRLTATNRTARALYASGQVPPTLAGAAAALRLHEADGVTPLSYERVPLVRAMRDGAVTGAEVVALTPGRPARLLRCDGWALRDAHGTVLGAVVVTNDVTDVHRVQTELAQSKAALEQAHAALTTREAFFRQVLDTVDVAIVACDPQQQPTFLNRAARDLQTIPSTTGSVIPGLFTPDGSAQLRPEQLPLQRALVEGSVDGMEVRARRTGVADRRLLVHGRALHDGDGCAVGAVAAAHDITALRTGQEALRRSEELFRAAFAHGLLGMCRLDGDGVLTELNPSLQRLLDRPVPLLLGRPLVSLVHEQDRAAVSEALSRPGGRLLEVRIPRCADDDLWCELALSRVEDQGGESYLFAQVADVTARKQHALALEQAARCDALTGLGNRRMLLERLECLLAGSRGVAVLFVDLDDFKAVNDDHGHDVGDAVLVAVAGRLLEAVRPEDVVVRLGGDEFVLVCPADDGEAGAVAASLAARVTELLVDPIAHGDVRLVVRASIGTTVALPGRAAPGTAVAAADAAMYRAKTARRTTPGGRGAGASAVRRPPPARPGPVRRRRRPAGGGVPAGGRPADRRPGRRRGAAADAGRRGWRRRSGRVHPRRGGHRGDPRDRHLGCCGPRLRRQRPGSGRSRRARSSVSASTSARVSLMTSGSPRGSDRR